MAVELDEQVVLEALHVFQVGASAAAGALAGADINRMLAIADTDAALQGIAE